MRPARVGQRPLVLVVHGSSEPAADEVVARIAAQVPFDDVHVARLDSASDARWQSLAPAVLVPLLLAGGFHAGADVQRLVRPGDVVTAPLGPDPLLVDALVDRLAEVGARHGDDVVLAAVGSREPQAGHDVELMAEWVSERGFRVDVGYLTTSPSIRDVIGARSNIVVAPYVLAPGVLAGRLAELSCPVAGVLADHPAVIRVIAERYASAVEE